MSRAVLSAIFRNRHSKSLGRDAFSHSAQCDEYFGASAMESVDATELNGQEHYPLLPGGEVPHAECNCWCHMPVFDKNEAPEYIKDFML